MRLRNKKQIERTKDQRWLTESRVITRENIQNLKAAGGVVGMNKSRKQSQSIAKRTQKHKGKAPAAKVTHQQRTVHFTSDSEVEEWLEINSGTQSPASIWSDTVILATPKLSTNRQLFPPSSSTPPPAPSTSTHQTMSLPPRH